jgi:Protein of unknown function (DUF2510)/Matrixin
MGKRGGGDDEGIRPAKPGWYPDPWSADGRGERYFDGKKWGTAERPLGREATVTALASRRGRGLRGRLRSFGPLMIFVAAVLAVWGIPKLLHSHHGAPRTADGLPPITLNIEDRPPAGVEEASKALGVPAPVPAGNGKFETLRDQPDNQRIPVAFDPCRPVHYVVNPAGAPADGMALLRSAIARVHTATGLQFVDDGLTDEKPSKDRDEYQPQRYPGRWAPVLIAWSDEKSFPELAGYVDGIGQPLEWGNGNEFVYVSGQLVLDRRDLSVRALPDRALARATILHELGHVVGLAHTSDRRQLMFSELRTKVTDYAQGDLRGLALLGTQRCFPGV